MTLSLTRPCANPEMVTPTDGAILAMRSICPPACDI